RLRQPGRAANWKMARIVPAEQADRAIDVRGQHGNAGRDRLGNDVRSAFAQRREDDGPGAAEQAPYVGLRPIATPDVARIDLHLSLRQRRPARRFGSSEVDDTDV